MCDYSLHHVASRLAKIEDKLMVTKFNNSITRGFAAIGEPRARRVSRRCRRLVAAS